MGGGGDDRHRPFEGGPRGVARFLHAAHLADVLTGCGFDLFMSGDRLEAAQCRDVPAHARDGTNRATRFVTGAGEVME